MAVLTTLPYPGGIIKADNAAPYQDIYTASVTQNLLLGTKLEFADGRVFRYAKAGAAALVQARMCQSSVTSATYFTAVVQTGHAQVVGATDINILVVTGSAEPENSFAGGWMMCNKVSPAVLGDIYRIVASKLRSTDTILDLKLASAIRNAIGVTGELTLTRNKFFQTVVFAAYDATAPAIGVPLCPVPINYFYWSQVKGPAPLLVDGSETYDIGQMVGCPVTLATAGDGGPHITTTAEVLRKPWGVCMEIATDGEPGLVDLMLE